ncbi:MAG TPA: D-alanyl-D-alanine carboxypeptidase [Pyrinomonadaceae bacterium]|nr:D-alanyl-D-alanine carboxypeptidase [Pyrinomonadaceae bacterium]
MLNKTLNRTFAAVLLSLCAAIVGFAQGNSPLLQDIKVVKPAITAAPVPTATPLVKKTGAVTTSPALPGSNVRTMFPMLAEVEIPGYSGVVIETLDNKTVLESNPGYLFNPASNVKVATAFAVLKTFGPEFRFATNVYTDGVVDRANGVLNGNLYISGKDPIFGFEHAISIANELNRLGIRQINGDLVVTDNFVMNYAGSSLVSAKALAAAMDANTRSAAALRTWQTHLANSGRAVTNYPSVSFTGATYVQSVPSNLSFLFSHESAPMRDILKAILCYSNNFLSERLGEMVGGPYAVARTVQLQAGVPANEFSLQTSSGLGYNRVTPNAMMKLLRALRSDLSKYKMTFSDIMPVAGIDQGTLANRFDMDGFNTGSVVGKTGTLGNTDAGVSALAGEMNTRQGRLLFVIFNQRGSVPRFRSFQNSFISLVQSQFGGPTALEYSPQSLDVRLARSRIVTAQGKAY